MTFTRKEQYRCDTCSVTWTGRGLPPWFHLKKVNVVTFERHYCSPACLVAGVQNPERHARQ